MYHEYERLVFGPFDRGDDTPIFADPLAVYRALVLGTAGEHNRLLAETADPVEEKRLAAEDRLCPVAREALGMLPFNAEDGSGATDQHVLRVLRAYCDWMVDQKKKGRDLADLLAAYGGGRTQLSYAEHVSLWLNLPRVLSQQAWAVKTGIELALTRGPLPADVVDALTRTDTEAVELNYRLNADRLMQDRMKGTGWDE